jgi:phosphatidylglycerophosphate synthase
LINALSISLWVNGTIPSALVALWLIRDVLLMVATHRFVAQNTTPGMAVMDPVTVPIQVTPTTISKFNTALQFITLTVGVVAISPSESASVVADTANAASTIFCAPTTDHWNDALILRIFITDTVFPALCWMTGITTVVSFFSYWGHSAFVTATTVKTTSRH